MKIEKPAMVVMIVAVLVSSFGGAMLERWWLGTIMAWVVGFILIRFFRSKGYNI